GTSDRARLRRGEGRGQGGGGSGRASISPRAPEASIREHPAAAVDRARVRGGSTRLGERLARSLLFSHRGARDGNPGHLGRKLPESATCGVMSRRRGQNEKAPRGPGGGRSP